jgi:hypothetical protein
MTPEGKALKEAYQWEIRAQWKGKPLEGDIEISLTSTSAPSGVLTSTTSTS